MRFTFCLGLVILSVFQTCGADSSIRGAEEFKQLDEALEMENNEEVGSMNREGDRKLIGWLSFIMEVAHCPKHGPLSHAPHCNRHRNNSGGDSSGSSTSSSGGTDADTSSSGGTDADSSNNANGASSGGGTSGTTTDATNANVNGGASSAMSASSRVVVWGMMAVAAAAVVGAIAAVAVGSRKRRVQNHPLSGSVGRRMGLFSNFANKCDTGNRPDRLVEMNGSEEAASSYRLA